MSTATAQQIYRSFLAKAGGDFVIGQTRSSKPVHAHLSGPVAFKVAAATSRPERGPPAEGAMRSLHAQHFSHYTQADHHDAFRTHAKLATASGNFRSPKAPHHLGMANAHAEMAKFAPKG